MNPGDFAEFRRLRKIEANLGILRIIVAILPIWVVGEVISRLPAGHSWGYGTAVLILTALLLVLSIVRQVMTSWIVGPEHRFFNDARRVAAFIDRTRQRGYIPVRGPSELLKVKMLNLVLRPIGWAMLLAFLVGGYQYVMDGLSAGNPWPVYAGLLFQWGMPALFLISVSLAILDAVRTIRSHDVSDFPLSRAFLRTHKHR